MQRDGILSSCYRWSFGLAGAIDLRALSLALFECLILSVLQNCNHGHLSRICPEMSHPKHRWAIVFFSSAGTRGARGSISIVQIFFVLGRLLCLCTFSTSLLLCQPHLIHEIVLVMLPHRSKARSARRTHSMHFPVSSPSLPYYVMMLRYLCSPIRIHGLGRR